MLPLKMQGQYSRVLIHPTSILSITDHHMRSKQERVVGIALGIIIDNILHVTNTYAVPFEEKSESLWFLDTTYLITMYDLLRRVTISEKIVGWYHTGGSIFKNDISISKSLEQFVERPLLMVVDVHSYNTLPIKLLRYENNDFVYTKYDIVSDESEKIGLEHMIKVMRIDHFDNDELIFNSLDSYRLSLEKIENYLEDVIQGKIRKNYKILHILQECLLNRPDISCCEEKKALECYALELTRAIVDLNELEHNRNENKIKSN